MLSRRKLRKFYTTITSQVMEKPSKLPKLVVLDLDYTLWPFWVDTHVDPPFKKRNNKVVDARGKAIIHYEDAPKVLKTLHDWEVPMAVASRTSEIDGANELVELFGWNEYFKYKEIYPGPKTNHFKKFHEYSGIPYEEMLFFDDEERNIKDLSQLKVTCVLVKDGMTMSVLSKGLKLFAGNNGK